MAKYKIPRNENETPQQFFTRMAELTGPGIDNYCNPKLKNDEAYGTLEFDGELSQSQIDEVGAELWQ